MDNNFKHLLSLVSAAGRRYPHAWADIEKAHLDRRQGRASWPTWCFLPMETFLRITEPEDATELTIPWLSEIARLCAVGSWRYTQGVYRIDTDVADALLTTNITGDIPAQVLYRLPEWCVYVVAPERMSKEYDIIGFFAHLEWDAHGKCTELRLLYDDGSGWEGLWHMILHVGGWSILEGLERAAKTAARAVGHHYSAEDHQRLWSGVMQHQVLIRLYQQTLSLLIYLCQDQPDIDGPRQPSISAPPPLKKTKKGWRLFAPPKPRIWRAGVITGEKLRTAAQKQSDRQGPTPHIRRAHWHGYWIGQGRKKFKLRWIAPVFVSCNHSE